MAIPPKEGRLIYHLTAIENLEHIFSGGLAPRNVLEKFVDVADKEIIDRRIEKNLNSYVPFHFFAGSPFAGAVQRRHTDTSFVFITVSRVFAELKDFKVLAQHPLSLEDCTPKSYKEGFAKMDWETMQRREYKDHDCCEVCMAECLSPNIIQPTDFHCIYTKTDAMNEQVIALRNKVLGYEAFIVSTNNNFFV